MIRVNSLWLVAFLLFSAPLPAKAQDESLKSSKFNDPEQHFNRGLEHYKAGRLKEAIETFKRALKLNAKEPETSYYLGEAYYSSELYGEAIKAYKQAIKLKPNHSAAHNNLGMSYLKLGQFKQAVESFNDTIRLEPDYSLAYYNLGAAYLERGERNAALEQLMILRTIDPQRASKLSSIFSKSGRPAAGVVFNGKAVALPEPKYLQTAGAARPSGTAVVIVTIDESGRVISARPLKGHPLLLGPSVKAALKARFTPTSVNGQAVKVTGIMTYNFTRGERPRPMLPSYVMYL